MNGYLLTWPHFKDGESTTLRGLSSEANNVIGFGDPLALARAADANGIDAAYQVLDRKTVEAARREGMHVVLWTANTDATLSEYCQWPIEGVITDRPEASPCL